MTTISFEYFPPKTDKGAAALLETAATLAALNPAFMTVTFGTGGGTKDTTFDMVTQIQDRTGIPVASHLTYLSMKKPALHDYAEKLWAAGIKRLVALRGDLPEGKTMADYDSDDYYRYTSDFVEGLMTLHDFDISVGAYPEKHPDAPSLDADIAALKLKCDAGATRAITQFFFTNDCYYRFVEKARKAGIATPIVPGLLPIGDFTSMLRFAARCNTKVPAELREKFAGLEDKPLEDRPIESQKIAQDVLVDQCNDLIDNGVQHIHFYTLNKTGLTMQACKSCNLAV